MPTITRDEVATPEEVAQARKLYADASHDDIEVDDDALVSRMDDGTWVLAWVWLPKPEYYDSRVIEKEEAP